MVFFKHHQLFTFFLCWSSSIHNQCHSNVMTSYSMGNVNSMFHPICESNPMDDLNVGLYTHITWCTFLSHFYKSLGTFTSLFKFSQNTSFMHSTNHVGVRFICFSYTLSHNISFICSANSVGIRFICLVTHCHTTPHSWAPPTPVVLNLYVMITHYHTTLIHALHQQY
jgi:hypothetical protein